MSVTYTVTPLDLGGVRREKSFFTYMKDVGTQIDLVVVSFLLRSDRHTILVDTGGPPPSEAARWHLPYDQAEHQSLRAQLTANEVDPAEVDAVIYTHLHWDHAYNAQILTGARFFVARRELDFAKNPCPIQDWMYDAPVTGHTPDYVGIDFDFTDPDREVLDGIRVVPTPGHSPGHQSVVVPTADGTVVLAGDVAPLQENWDTRTPNGMLHNLEEHFASFARLEAVGGHVIPSHDPRILDPLHTRRRGPDSGT